VINLADTLYFWEQWANQWVTQELQHLTPVSLGLVLGAGVVTSLNPCVLSLLPVTVAWVASTGNVLLCMVLGNLCSLIK